jgi:hypothetical protein
VKANKGNILSATPFSHTYLVAVIVSVIEEAHAVDFTVAPALERHTLMLPELQALGNYSPKGISENPRCPLVPSYITENTITDTRIEESCYWVNQKIGQFY